MSRLHKSNIELIDEIIYPTGGTSRYNYEIKDQYESENWDEWNEYTTSIPGYPEWEANVEERYYGTVRYYGQKTVVREHSRAGKQISYTYTMNNESGNLQDNNFIPANIYLLSSETRCGGRTTEETYRHLVFDGYYHLVDEPEDSAFYKGTLPVSMTITLGNNVYEKTTYDYHLPIRAVYQETDVHYPK